MIKYAYPNNTEYSLNLLYNYKVVGGGTWYMMNQESSVVDFLQISTVEKYKSEYNKYSQINENFAYRNGLHKNNGGGYFLSSYINSVCK